MLIFYGLMNISAAKVDSPIKQNASELCKKVCTARWFSLERGEAFVQRGGMSPREWKNGFAKLSPVSLPHFLLRYGSKSLKGHQILVGFLATQFLNFMIPILLYFWYKTFRKAPVGGNDQRLPDYGECWCSLLPLLRILNMKTKASLTTTIFPLIGLHLSLKLWCESVSKLSKPSSHSRSFSWPTKSFSHLLSPTRTNILDPRIPTSFFTRILRWKVDPSRPYIGFVWWVSDGTNLLFTSLKMSHNYYLQIWE